MVALAIPQAVFPPKLAVLGLEMSPEAAQNHVSRIKAHLENAEHHVSQARALILDLFNGKGWAALGYKSWRQCVLSEFEQGSSMLYKELRAAQVEMELSPAGTIGAISERVLRPLTKKGYTTEARQAVWDIATTIVGAGGKVTSGVVEAIADGLEEMLASGTTQDSNGAQHPITERMSADLIARVRETKIAHKQHIRGMDNTRNYIVGRATAAVRTDTTTKTTQIGSVALNLAQAEMVNEALRLGKPIYISLWTEDSPQENSPTE